LEGREAHTDLICSEGASSGGGAMGPRRKASQAAHGRGVPGAEGVFDFEEEAQEEPQGLICALRATPCARA